MNLVKQFIAIDDKGPRPGIALNRPESITLHWIGPFPAQSVNDPVNWWVSRRLQASAHFVVKDSDVLNCIPINEVAWHCGTKGNYSSIGIEVVPATVEGVFSALTIFTLGELLATLPNVKLLRHFDWTGKDCPRYYTPIVPDGDKKWQELKEQLHANS